MHEEVVLNLNKGFKQLWKDFAKDQRTKTVKGADDDKVWYCATRGRYLLLLLQNPQRFAKVARGGVVVRPATINGVYDPNNERMRLPRIDNEPANVLVTGISETSLVNVTYWEKAREDLKDWLKDQHLSPTDASLDPTQDESFAPEVTIMADYMQQFVHAPLAKNMAPTLAATRTAIFLGKAVADYTQIATWLNRCKKAAPYYYSNGVKITATDGAPSGVEFSATAVNNIVYIEGPGRPAETASKAGGVSHPEEVCYCTTGDFSGIITADGKAQIVLSMLCVKPYADGS